MYRDDYFLAPDEADDDGGENSRLLIKGLALLALLLPMLVFAALSDAQQKEAASMNKMMSAARSPDVAGQAGQIDALKQRLAAMPKPARGDRAAAGKANDAGLESFRREEEKCRRP